MRVLHIIPSAFNYFDDIRVHAFAVVDGLHRLGIETEAFTVQYGSVGKNLTESVKSVSPAHTLAATTGAQGLGDSLQEFDVVHVHCPFLGAARQLLQWKQAFPGKLLVVTYYRDVSFSDGFSLFVKIYNAYFLPKIFRAADVVICNSVNELTQFKGAKYIPAQQKLIGLDEIILEKKWGTFDSNQAVAAKVLLVYNSFIRKA